VIPAPPIDARRAESLFQELRSYAPHYTSELDLSDEQGAGIALMKVFAYLAEAITVRLDQVPEKNFIAFLDSLGIGLLPARPARALVAFKVASGVEEPVQVPSGARVTASGAEGEIPFETSGELLALPDALKAVYGVDPPNDQIFVPPPDFLSQKPRTPTELKYTIQSSVLAGSNRMQLDHTTELVAGAFLRIGGDERKIVKKLDEGNIVTLSEPVKHAYEPPTTVLPIRDFEVFDGINVQEHVLYLGHSSLLTVKEAAEITLQVGLAGVPAGGLLPLNLVWQFWTQDDAQGEYWHDLTVTSDQTGGFASSGAISLLKPEKYEIKERTVNGTKSRWIRAQLQDPLPAGSRALPDIDTIKIAVKSAPTTQAGQGFPADQGFYNATPLAVAAATGFFPFGTEPRQFDQFYIASKEAFSKRAAEVHLDFTLDMQKLAAPSVVIVNPGPSQQVRAYSIGLRRRLYELNADNGQFAILDSPFETPLPARPQGSRYFPVENSIPSAVAAGGSIYVFVTTEDGLDQDANKANMLWVFLAGVPWVPLDAPPSSSGKKRLKFGPAAIQIGPVLRVFVISGDGKLCSRDVDTAGAAPAASGNWQQYDPPANYPAAQPWQSAPFVVVVSGNILVFVTGSDGVVHWITFLASGGLPVWTPLVPNNPFQAVSRPFAQPIGSGSTEAKVFVFGRDTGGTGSWKLFECDTRSLVSGKFYWDDLDRPVNTEDYSTNPDDHAPAGYIEDPPEVVVNKERKHIFLRGADNHLYERLDDKWEQRPLPVDDPDLRGSPAVCVTSVTGPPDTDTIRVFAASSRNSLVTWTFEATHGTIANNADAQGVLLDEILASSANGTYENMNLTITNVINNFEVRPIIAYDGALKLARVFPKLSSPPDNTFACKIGTTNLGFARNDADRLFTFHKQITNSPKASLLYIRIGGTDTTPDFYSRVTGLISLNPWDAVVAAPFALYAQLATVSAEYLPLEDTNTVPELSWEYWDGRGWLSLPVTDGTHNYLSSGEVVFNIDTPIQQTEVAGQANFWIRVRLVGGDYGRETFKIVNNQVVPEKSSLRPPKITRLRIRYDTQAVSPETCLTFNNLDYLDQTGASQTAGAHFRPFETLEETSRAIFFGFDRTFQSGPVRLLLDAAERDFDDSKPLELAWSFRKDRRWKELDADDASVALTRAGILSLSASDSLTRESRFGRPLFWIRGAQRTREGVQPVDYPLPLLRGVFLNTVAATQGETFTDEILASSDGEANQKHALRRPDVLEGEDIRVQESLSVEERKQIELDFGSDSVADREDVGGTWVRWQEVQALFDCGPEERCYTIDRATGVVQFGDGVHGNIPPAGVDNIRAFRYRSGGGSTGNVAAGKITALATAVAGIESVLNPTPAGGGSDKAGNDDMLAIGPRRLSHLDRAVSAKDFEELAYEASRQVAKARCLITANLKPDGDSGPDPCDPRQRYKAQDAPGWVSLIIVPDSPDPAPCPSVELRRAVRDYLRTRAPSLVTAGDRIVVRPPDYAIVTIQADIFVTSLDQASVAETKANASLVKFLHPLRGGPAGTGWEFGRPVLKSDIFAVLERIAEIDHVEKLVFAFNGQTSAEAVDIGPNELPASGEHRLSVKRAKKV